MRAQRIFALNSFCFLIKGAKKSCIYDLLTGEVYSIDEGLSKVLHKEILTIEEIEEKADNAGIPKKSLYKKLEKLVSLGIGRFINNKIFIDKPYFDFKENIRKMQLVDLQKMSVRTTSECSLNCIFCDIKNPKICFPCSRFSSYSNKQIGSEELKRALYDAWQFNCKEIMFTGGDPFKTGLSFIEILSYAYEYYENIEVFSNLYHLTKEIKKALEEFNKKVEIFSPIFGDENIHDLISGEKGSFKQSIKNVIDLKEIGIKIKAIVLKIKDRDYKNLVNFFKKENIQFQFFLPIPIRNDKYTSEFFAHFFIEPQGFDKIDVFNFFYRRNFNQCWGRQIFIDTDGKARPCLFTNEMLGELSNYSLRDILREGRQDKYWYLTKDKINTCLDCEFRYCCPLDCRVASEAYSGSIDSKYPFCYYDPYVGKWIMNR